MNCFSNLTNNYFAQQINLTKIKPKNNVLQYFTKSHYYFTLFQLNFLKTKALPLLVIGLHSIQFSVIKCLLLYKFYFFYES